VKPLYTETSSIPANETELNFVWASSRYCLTR
jgi:hypothetical protein